MEKKGNEKNEANRSHPGTRTYVQISRFHKEACIPAGGGIVFWHQQATKATYSWRCFDNDCFLPMRDGRMFSLQDLHMPSLGLHIHITCSVLFSRPRSLHRPIIHSSDTAKLPLVCLPVGAIASKAETMIHVEGSTNFVSNLASHNGGEEDYRMLPWRSAAGFRRRISDCRTFATDELPQVRSLLHHSIGKKSRPWDRSSG